MKHSLVAPALVLPNDNNNENNKDVFILTNFHDPLEMSEVQRKQKDGTKCVYPCPPCVADYNKNMSAVDKFDQLMTSYKLDRRSKKW